MKRFLLAIAAVFIFAWPVLLMTGCASTGGGTAVAEQVTRSGLELVAGLAEPASKLAFEQCEHEKTALAEAGRQAELEKAIARCAKVIDAFDRIAIIHDAAATALERGDLKLAQSLLDQVKSLWASARGGP